MARTVVEVVVRVEAGAHGHGQGVMNSRLWPGWMAGWWWVAFGSVDRLGSALEDPQVPASREVLFCNRRLLGTWRWHRGTLGSTLGIGPR